MERKKSKSLSFIPEKSASKGELEIESLDPYSLKVLKDLTKDQTNKHHAVLEKIYKYAQHAKENDRKWLNKCRELTAEIAANSTKVVAAIRLAEEDQHTIETLKQELDKAWKMVDSTTKYEQKARERIMALKHDIEKLTHKNKPEEKEKDQEEIDNLQLMKIKEVLVVEKEGLLSEVGQLKEEITKAMESRAEMEKNYKHQMEVIEQLKKQNMINKAKGDREVKMKENAEKEITKLRAELVEKQALSHSLEKNEVKLKDDLTKLQKQLKEKAKGQDKYQKDLETSKLQQRKQEEEYESLSMSLKVVNAERNALSQETEKKDEAIAILQKELADIKRECKSLFDKLHSVKGQSEGADSRLLELQAEIAILNKQLDNAKQEQILDEKTIGDLNRERDKLLQAILLNDATKDAILNKISEQEQIKGNMEKQLVKLRTEVSKQSTVIVQVEKERDVYVNKVGELELKMQSFQDELKMYQCLDFPKQLAEADSKIDNYKIMMQDAREERNTYDKKYRMLLDEVNTLKDQLKLRDKQIFQLEEQVALQDKELQKTMDTLEHSYMKGHDITNQLNSQNVHFKQTLQEKHHMKTKIENLMNDTKRLEEEKNNLQRKLNHTTSDKNILGTQLTRRNDELYLLQKALAIQEETIIRGERQYNERLNDIRLLKLQIQNMARELGLLRQTAANGSELRQELFHVKKNFTNEQSRSLALEQELQTPLNVHRWRILEGSDAERYELIQKVCALKKQLTHKRQQIVDQAVDMKEKDRLLKELKEATFRPEEDLANKVRQYQGELNAKNKALKDSDENEKDMFYSQLQDILNSVKKGDISLVLGNFNAKVGTDSDLWAGVLGPFGIGSSNGNGERLIQTMEAQLNMYETYMLDYQNEVGRLNTELHHLQRKLYPESVPLRQYRERKTFELREEGGIIRWPNQSIAGPKKKFRGGGYRIA